MNPGTRGLQGAYFFWRSSMRASQADFSERSPLLLLAPPPRPCCSWLAMCPAWDPPRPPRPPPPDDCRPPRWAGPPPSPRPVGRARFSSFFVSGAFLLFHALRAAVTPWARREAQSYILTHNSCFDGLVARVATYPGTNLYMMGHTHKDHWRSGVAPCHPLHVALRSRQIERPSYVYMWECSLEQPA